MKKPLATAALAGVLTLVGSSLASAAGATRVQVTGEIIDTWCYIAEVMGGGEAITGSAHHQCAVWCAAGGIPVGLLGEDGTVYMIMSFEGETTSNANPAVLDIQSHQITVDGELYQRDGVNYLLVEKIVSDQGIVNRSHEDYGVIPAFGVPKQ